MMTKNVIINRNHLIDLINLNGGKETVFRRLRKELCQSGFLHRIQRSTYSPATITRILSGFTNKHKYHERAFSSFYQAEIIFLAKILNRTLAELIDEEMHESLAGTGIDTYATSRNFGSDQLRADEDKEEELCRYFINIEQAERLVVCQDFPSSIYIINSHADQERYNQLVNNRSSNTEYYPIRSVMSFLFSPVTQFTKSEKTDIMKNILFALKKENRRVHLFEHKQIGFPSNFASMNIVSHAYILAILISVPYVVLEIKNKELTNLILDYFQDEEQKESIRPYNSAKIFEIFFDLLSRSDVDETAMIPHFLAACRERDLPKADIELIKQQFGGRFDHA